MDIHATYRSLHRNISCFATYTSGIISFLVPPFSRGRVNLAKKCIFKPLCSWNFSRRFASLAQGLHFLLPLWIEWPSEKRGLKELAVHPQDKFIRQEYIFLAPTSHIWIASIQEVGYPIATRSLKLGHITDRVTRSCIPSVSGEASGRMGNEKKGKELEQLPSFGRHALVEP